MILKHDYFPHVIHALRSDFLTRGQTVNRGEWQGKTDERPQLMVFEVHDVAFKVKLNLDQHAWQNDTQPNLPWAEDHFQERISGKPLNPGEQYKNWPWYEQGVEEHKETGEFSHTYMERFWPKWPIEMWDSESVSWEPRPGIRYDYGDLDDLMKLLEKRPYTRQAYLPIYFPEDLTASSIGERVPCTLGYHFQAMPKEGRALLSSTYFMRSCDYFRYLRDDVYMAGRLLQHVATAVGMDVGFLTVHIANLHIFNGEVSRLRDEHEAETQRRIAGAFS